jgi:hypothetical protein
MNSEQLIGKNKEGSGGVHNSVAMTEFLGQRKP